MPQPQYPTRCTTLRTAALGVLSLLLLNVRTFTADAALAPAKPAPLRLGCATYGQRALSVDDLLTALRLPSVALYKAHLNWETATPRRGARRPRQGHRSRYRDGRTGVMAFKNNEAACRQVFENAKVAQLTTMICKPDLDALPLVEKLVQEFDQKLAIHNHGPEDKVFPSPDHIWKEIERLDARIGFCIDVGHTARSGANPADVLRKYAARLYDVHMKDTVAIAGAVKDLPMEVGAGRLDIRGMLRALRDIRYAGVVSFEYEKPVGNPVTGLAESLGYVRGMLAGMA